MSHPLKPTYSAGPRQGPLVLSAAGNYRPFGDQELFSRPEAGYTPRAVLALLWRHKFKIAGCIVVGTILSTLLAFSLSKAYVAESLVILDTRQPDIVQQPAVLSNLVSGSTADPAIVRSEVALISSPAYARELIDRLHLLHNPIFERQISPGGWTEKLSNALVHLEAQAASFFGRPPPASPAAQLGRAINTLEHNLSVYNDEHSYAINLRYTSPDPVFSTMIVNSLAQLYLSDQLAVRQDAARRASAWLDTQVASLGKKVRAGNQAIANFEQEHSLEVVVGGNPTEQLLHELNLRALAAADDVARRKAALEEIQGTLSSDGGASSAPEVLASPLIQKLREQEVELEGRIAAVKERWSPSYPLGQSQLKVIRERISAEVQRIVEGLKEDLTAAELRETALRTRIHEQQMALDRINQARVRLDEMNRQVSVDSRLYETLLLRSQQVQADEQSLEAGARVVPAETPVSAAYPNKSLFIGFGFFGSAFLGVLLALVADGFDETIRTSEDMERVTGVPTLGMVPRLRNGRRALATLARAPMSVYSEAIGNILISLRVGRPGNISQVVCVTSSIPDEGKTVFAAALAAAAARAGCRALLIDCDMRQGSVGNLFGKKAPNALRSMFAQRRLDLAHFVQVDDASGLHYLATGHIGSMSPQEILGSRWMEDLIARARTEYDLVVVDTPPLVAVADGLLVSALVDTTLLVARWGYTPVGAVRHAMRLLHLHGECSIGTVLSMVDPREFRRYSIAAYYASYSEDPVHDWEPPRLTRQQR